MGGFGAGVLETLASQGLTIPVRVLGVPDRVFEQASQARLREQAGLTPDGIAAAVRTVVAAKSAPAPPSEVASSARLG